MLESSSVDQVDSRNVMELLLAHQWYDSLEIIGRVLYRCLGVSTFGRARINNLNRSRTSHPVIYDATAVQSACVEVLMGQPTSSWCMDSLQKTELGLMLIDATLLSLLVISGLEWEGIKFRLGQKWYEVLWDLTCDSLLSQIPTLSGLKPSPSFHQPLFFRRYFTFEIPKEDFKLPQGLHGVCHFGAFR